MAKGRCGGAAVNTFNQERFQGIAEPCQPSTVGGRFPTLYCKGSPPFNPSVPRAGFERVLGGSMGPAAVHWSLDDHP